MESTIKKDEIILIKEVKENELKINDIISFNDGKNIITHRIVNIENTEEKTYYTTKGDNNKNNDKDKITYEKIEGVYILKLSSLNGFTHIIKNKIFLISLFILLILNFAYMRRLNNRKNERKIKRQEYIQRKIEEK